MMNSEYSLKAVKQSIDDYLDKVIQKRCHEAKSVSEAYAKLWLAIRETATHSGKRVRPYLTVVGYGKMNDDILPIAASQELIHIAMLMHDDIIDRDYTRHGVKNISGLYREYYGRFLDDEDAVHYAHSSALLAGDLLISEAYRQISKAPVSQEARSKVSEQLSKSIYEVVGGELMDVESPFVSDVEFNPLDIYRYKTASYSFVGPLLSGAYCRGVSPDVIDCLESFAINLGVAYQIQDDLLGVYGDEAVVGKPKMSDFQEGKKTLLALHHQQMADDQQISRFILYGSEEITREQFEDIKKDMIESGAYDKTRVVMQDYFDRALQYISQISDRNLLQKLTSFVDQIKDRQQ